MALRHYQLKAKELIKEAFAVHRSVGLNMPTGSGKTVTFADMARDTVKNGKKVMIVVDRKELLYQSEKKLIEYGLTPCLIKPGRSVKTNALCYVASVETLVRRDMPYVDLLIIDEAHKQSFNKILKGTRYEHEPYVLGCSATFKRTGKMRQLSDYYNVLVEPTDISTLISEGFLAPAITYGAKVDTSKIKMKGDDYDVSELSNFFNKRIVYDDLLKKYQQYGAGTKAIVFHPSREISIEACRTFNQAGIISEHVDATTKKNVRESILEAFSAGSIQTVHNVEILTTGYDEWTIQTVMLNLATKSHTKFKQMAGRGSRVTPEKYHDVPGHLQKTHFNLIDMGGNIFVHGFWESPHEYSLTHKTKETLDAAPVKTCPEDKFDIHGRKGCGALLHLSAVKCKYCGWVFPVKEKAEPIQAEFTQLINTDFLPAGIASKTIDQMSIQELEEFRTAKGFKLGWIVIQIQLREDLDLLSYAQFMGYNNPQGLVAKWEQMYKIKIPKIETII